MEYKRQFCTEKNSREFELTSILWHVDPFLGNACKLQHRNGVFYVVRAEML
jgi:hypothetical protein